LAADAVPVHLYLVITERSLSRCQALEAWGYAQSRFDAAGIPVKLASLTEVQHEEVGFVDTLGADGHAQALRMFESQKYLARHGGIPNWEVSHFIYPPMECSPGWDCWGGVSQRICGISGGGFSLGQGGPWSSHTPPRNRIPASGMVMAHEIAHSLGAYHQSGADVGDSRNFPPNIMDLAAGRFIDTVPLWFLPLAISDMEYCLGISAMNATGRCLKKFKGPRNRIKRRSCIKRVKRKAPVLRSGGVVDGPEFIFK
jgi:hypothetical protein